MYVLAYRLHDRTKLSRYTNGGSTSDTDIRIGAVTAKAVSICNLAETPPYADLLVTSAKNVMDYVQTIKVWGKVKLVARH